MKPFMITLLMAVAMNIASFAQQPAQIVPSRLQEATMYFNGAQLTRTTTANVPAGITELVFSPLSADIDPSSIQVNARGNFTILSATHRNNYLESPEQDKKQMVMQDSLDLLNRQVALNQAFQKALEEEEQMLMANKSIGGSENGVEVEELRAVANFLRERLRDIKRQHITLQEQIVKDQERIRRLRQQVGQLNNIQRQPVGQIVVHVSAPAAGKGEFTLNYLVQQAGWQPMYDIRVADTDQPVDIILKASAYQHTHENWNNVMLTFSTGDPRQYGQRPALYPWRLDFLPEEQVIMPRPMRKRVELQEMMIVDDDVELEGAATGLSYVDTREARTTYEYKVNQPYNLVAGGGTQLVELEQNKIPARYEYFVAPRLSQDAFLVARIADWEQYALMTAEASIFFEGTYLGKTMLNPHSQGDTLELSLGRDASILVSRERMKEFSRKSLFGNRVTETHGWEINVRNTKRTPILINIEEQYPLSVRQELEVNLEESSGAAVDKERGFLTWRMELKAGESQARNMRYTVRYPSGKRVIVE